VEGENEQISFCHYFSRLMSAQDLVDLYVDQLKAATTAEEVTSVVQQSLYDRQLFLYGEILTTLRNYRIAIDQQFFSILELFAFGEFSAANDWVRNDAVLSDKLRMLTVVSAVYECGLVVPIGELERRLDIGQASDIFQLLLRMRQAKLVEVAIDELGGKVTFLSINLCREIPPNISVEDIRRELLEIADRVNTTSFSLPEKILQCHQGLSKCSSQKLYHSTIQSEEPPKKTPSKRIRQPTY